MKKFNILFLFLLGLSQLNAADITQAKPIKSKKTKKVEAAVAAPSSNTDTTVNANAAAIAHLNEIIVKIGTVSNDVITIANDVTPAEAKPVILAIQALIMLYNHEVPNIENAADILYPYIQELKPYIEATWKKIEADAKAEEQKCKLFCCKSEEKPANARVVKTPPTAPTSTTSSPRKAKK